MMALPRFQRKYLLLVPLVLSIFISMTRIKVPRLDRSILLRAIPSGNGSSYLMSSLPPSSLSRRKITILMNDNFRASGNGPSYLKSFLPPSSLPRKKITILLYDNFRGYTDWMRPEDFVKKARDECSTECIVTEDKDALIRADGVLFHAQTHNTGAFPARRGKQGQKFVIVTLEVMKNQAVFQNDPNFMKKFDYTATYELNSTVPVITVHGQYQASYYHEAEKLTFHQKDGFGESNALAAFISNCNPARLELLVSLSQYMPVHSYGGCMRNRTEPQLDTTSRNANKRKILQRYKFYLAFENSVVDDYVTEKVFDGLLGGTLPVYRGTPSIDKFMPYSLQHPAVIKLSDFKDMRELSEYLNHLANNETAYESYFRWKQLEPSPNFESILNMTAYTFHALCRMCAKLAEVDGPGV